MKKTKLAKGITLIALIITIIILLILAAVTIGTMKNNGIIEYSQKASSEYVIAQEKEKIAIAINEYQIREAMNQSAEENTLNIKEAMIEQIGNYGWKISYPKTGNVYGINSKGEYDEAITRIIEVSEATGVSVENFIVYEDKFAIKQNRENANTEGYNNMPEKYIFYNWATVDVNDIEKIEKRKITSQPENSLICDMSNRALAYDLNGDGYIDAKDDELKWYLQPGTSNSIEEINKYIPEYTMEKNIKYSSLLGLGGEYFDGITYNPILFCSAPEMHWQSTPEGTFLSYLSEGVYYSLQEIIQTVQFLYYTYER